IPAGRTKHDDPATRHVLTAVIADGLDDRMDTAVPHAEALPGHAADVRLPAGRAVERHVADDHVLFRHKRRAGRRVDDDLAAGEALADVVVRVAFQAERHAARDEGPEALSRRAPEVQVDRVARQAYGAVAPRDLAADNRANHAVDVADWKRGRDWR